MWCAMNVRYMYVCVCMYICIYAHMCVYVCIYIYIHTHTYTDTYTYTYTHIYVNTRVICMCMYIYIYIYTHITYHISETAAPGSARCERPGKRVRGPLMHVGTAPTCMTRRPLGTSLPRLPPTTSTFGTWIPEVIDLHREPFECRMGTLLHTANLRTKILDFRGFDPSKLFISRSGMLMSIGIFPEVLSQQILDGRILVLVGRLGVLRLPRPTSFEAPWTAPTFQDFS